MRGTYVVSVLFFAGVQAAFGSVISIGPVPLTGQGLGAVQTALIFSSPGVSTIESGCVAAGVGGITVTGPAACPAGFAGGDEVAISLNNTYTAASLGFTNFNDFQVIFNPNEPQVPILRSITLTSLAITLWNPATGLILDAKYTPGPIVFPNTDPGVGNAGFGFELDAAQAGDFNLRLAACPHQRIGVAATATDANGGFETISFRATNIAIPEPSTYALLGSALAALALLRRKTL
jgi:hypothetical protein